MRCSLHYHLDLVFVEAMVHALSTVKQQWTYQIELRPVFVQRFQMQCLSKPMQLQTVKKDYKNKKYCNVSFQPEHTCTLAKYQEFPQQLNTWICRNTYLSSLSRQCTKIGNIPDFIRSSIGGLRSLESSFLFKEIRKYTTQQSQNEKRGLEKITEGHLVQHCAQSAVIANTTSGQPWLCVAECQKPKQGDSTSFLDKLFQFYTIFWQSSGKFSELSSPASTSNTKQDYFQH